MARDQRALRLPCDLPCEIVQNAAVVPGQVVDTSVGGLKVMVAGRFPFTGLVTVSLGAVGLRFDAEVRWRTTHLAGLRILRSGELGARPSLIRAA